MTAPTRSWRATTAPRWKKCFSTSLADERRRARHERSGGIAMSEVATVSGISPHRIHAMVLRYWYLLMSSWPRLLELVYWPALQVITWGFLQNYIAQNDNFFAR